jgi:lysyl-tRNA synthetase class 2
MLEWYRAGELYDAVVDDTVALVRLAAETAGRNLFAFRGVTCEPAGAPERLSVADAFERFAGMDLLATVSADGTPDRDALAASCRRADIRVAADDTWSDLFSRVLVARVEPGSGSGGPRSWTAIPPLKPRSPDGPPMTRGSRSVSNSTSAASNSRTASAS